MNLCPGPAFVLLFSSRNGISSQDPCSSPLSVWVLLGLIQAACKWMTGTWVPDNCSYSLLLLLYLLLLRCTFKPNPTSLFVSLNKGNWQKEGEGQLTGTSDHNWDWLLVLPLLQVGYFSWEKHQAWKSGTRTQRHLCSVWNVGSAISVGLNLTQFDSWKWVSLFSSSGLDLERGANDWIHSVAVSFHTAVSCPGFWSSCQLELATFFVSSGALKPVTIIISLCLSSPPL